MEEWVKGVLPTKSGNYAVRYNGIEGRDDFTTNGNHWWNNGNTKHLLELFREIIIVIKYIS